MDQKILRSTGTRSLKYKLYGVGSEADPTLINYRVYDSHSKDFSVFEEDGSGNSFFNLADAIELINTLNAEYDRQQNEKQRLV